MAPQPLQFPILETARALLRRLRMEDAEDLFEYASNPEVSIYTTWSPHRTMDDSLAFLSRELAQPLDPAKAATWGITDKSLDKLIGTARIIAQGSPQDARAEIGYAIAQPYWGKGWMTEIAQRLVRYGFEEMGMNRVEALCLPENIASARVMEKCGMRYEGTLRQYVHIKGEYADLKMHSILREEWQP